MITYKGKVSITVHNLLADNEESKKVDLIRLKKIEKYLNTNVSKFIFNRFGSLAYFNIVKEENNG